MTTPRTLEDIANELSRSSGSLNSSVASVISADSSEPSESGHSSNGGSYKSQLKSIGVGLQTLSHDLQGVAKKKEPPSKMAYLVYNDYK